jgi:hypothetical protein
MAYVKGQEEGRSELTPDLFLRTFMSRYHFNRAHLIETGRRLGYSLQDLENFLNSLKG